MAKNRYKYKFFLSILLAGVFFFLPACSSEETSSNPPYTEWLTLTQFENEVSDQMTDGRYPVEIQGREIDNTKEFRAVFASFDDPFSYYVYTNLTQTEFLTNNDILSAFGYELQHLDKIAFSSSTLFTAVWTTTNGLTEKELNPLAISISISGSSTLGTTECATLATANNGILLEVDENDCVIMESTDRKACREGDAYANCSNFSNSQNTCPGGTTQGSSPYLPNVPELTLMFNNHGEGNPVSSNNFCIVDSGDCASSASGTPFFYWSSDTSPLIINFTNGSAQTVTSTNLASIRCIMRIAL